MKLLRWFCTISIFLCATFTVSAQALEAVEYERVLFNGASPAEANAALLARARCLIAINRLDDALDALDRLRLFALSGDDRLTSNYLKAVAYYRSGNYDAASGCMDEGFPDDPALERDAVLILAGARRYDEALPRAAALAGGRAAEIRNLFAKAPARKNATTAVMLSLLPPLGQLYLNEGDWLPTTLMSYAGMALTAWQLAEANYVTAFLGGGLLLNASYMEHNIATAAQRTEASEKAAIESFLARLELLLDE